MFLALLHSGRYWYWIGENTPPDILLILVCLSSDIIILIEGFGMYNTYLNQVNFSLLVRFWMQYVVIDWWY